MDTREAETLIWCKSFLLQSADTDANDEVGI